ncbi:hypothetical protein QR680_016684 [Steinernema hermaphroditum]|uniref:DNTTIP1 dimerisation domain-containing protein n=1 Tax=Steinernema hermaphroditum TaxID=289476 RepID=A0AA39HCC8_9BILA|nr:hypothetical protein QR680_016684 [Steinernema hermaphroditum]
MVFDGTTTAPGSGYNNKMNRRNDNLEQFMESLGGEPSALRNTLRQAIERNNTDMADTAVKSLDLLREVHQETLTKEIRDLIGRHLDSTFNDAFMNLRRNNVNVSPSDINRLCRHILDGVKATYTELPKFENGDAETPCSPSAFKGIVDSKERELVEADLKNRMKNYRGPITNCSPEPNIDARVKRNIYYGSDRWVHNIPSGGTLASPSALIDATLAPPVKRERSSSSKNC